MHTLEPEVSELASEGDLDGPSAALALALERREVLSIHGELRIAIYVAVLLITSGVGLFVKAHLDRIGPPTILVAIGLAAAACYASAIRTQRLGRERTIVGDYVLLLGALLLSSELAYAEATYQLLGEHWSLHLLLLALIHGATAYLLDSRLVLSVALTSLAGWLGVESNLTRWSPGRWTSEALGGRALVCAAIVWAVRAVHGRSSTRAGFGEVYEHFAANLAFLGVLGWCASGARWPLGLLILVPLAAGAVWRGLRLRQEAFVVYGVGYGALGLLFVLVPRLGNEVASLGLSLLVVVGAALLLWGLHSQLREERL